MRIDVPRGALAAGFSNEPAGTHTSRTLMLEELRALFRGTGADATYADYAAAIVDDNALAKATRATRLKSLRHLRELYALDASVPLFSALRALWESDKDSQPVLTLLCAVARDPLLRATAELVTECRERETLTASAFSSEVERSFPHRFSSGVLGRIGRNIASSWTQSGHLRGRSSKTRVHAHASAYSMSYALFLGHLTLHSGTGLFRTIEARLLDVPEGDARELARAASRQGWITYRAAAGMTEIGFRQLESLTPSARRAIV
jgi:hypothetical protein